ncbi:PspC domain-containing protein [Pseudokineococcus sp. 5B2Z-1]|uniref:PspC domain-containing protein n=1 Tax=Pseudokineococcus sp. 5B2Z-1 TaxID=3132744 RepID=UPI00309D06D1
MLVRPRSGRVVAGVCAGLADRFGLSRTLVRLLFVLSFLLPGTQLLVYVVLWVLVPSEGTDRAARRRGL